MFRNRIFLLSMVVLLAVTSFGFISQPTNGVISTEGFIHRCPPGYRMVKEHEGVWCLRPVTTANNGTTFIQDNLLTVKVSPELAAVLALFEQPAGTQVANVSSLFIGTIPPYYVVTISNGNYVKSICINARNGNLMPPPCSYPASPSGNIFIPFRVP
ncbi:MAG: hypothetical protein P4L50_18040 [Anaerolineaceae bacterium]|nr:hypothetical protein [Anaerolineaceae bacterium]